MLSKAGINWNDLNVLSKHGINWNDYECIDSNRDQLE